jgi:proline dehydrogenase
MMRNEEPPAAFTEAMDRICEKAKSQGVRLWVDSEQQAVQISIDRWTLPIMRKYNANNTDTPLVYNTLQAYLKQSRPKLKAQIAAARQEGWTLAIKLVRGAYIDSDPRELIHDTKDDTDASYNGIVHDLLSGNPELGFSSSSSTSIQASTPKIHLFLAGHNPTSVNAAIDLMQTLSAAGKLKVKPEFGQLQGMADELGCSVLQRADEMRASSGAGGEKKGVNTTATAAAAVPLVYKCLTWGSVQECMQYLLRRAVENSGGTARMKDGYAAYAAELRRRVGAAVGLRG